MPAGVGMTSARTRVRLIDSLRRLGIANEEVLSAMSELPRHVFVEDAIHDRAYENIPLPIGRGQTISQPYTVARMTEILLAGIERVGGERDKVLEVGCGCGYQAALLSYFFKEVYAIERIVFLLEKARKHFQFLKLSNIYTNYADGNLGWVSAAPFDGVMISAATGVFPKMLLGQMRERSAAVFPFGEKSRQKIRLLTRAGEQQQTNDYDGVLFVPLLPGKG